jgi:hypothetical protein
MWRIVLEKFTFFYTPIMYANFEKYQEFTSCEFWQNLMHFPLETVPQIVISPIVYCSENL